MKIRTVETLHCDAGWRPWSFVKISTDDGLIGYAEFTNSQYSPWAVAGCIRDLEPLLIGRDPRAVEAIHWDLYRATRQSPGGIAQKGLGALENALLDIKAKALGVPVHELFGGPFRDRVRVYWSHCGTTRAYAAELIGARPLRSFADVGDLAREVVEKGFTALKTNIIIPGDPPALVRQGFAGPIERSHQDLSREMLRSTERLLRTFREAVGDEVDISLDVNFNFRAEGLKRLLTAIEPFDLLWIELDSYDPDALAVLKLATRTPLASGECLYTLSQFLPFLSRRAMDIAVVDVCWNGFARAKQVADYALGIDLNVVPHNYYSHLATLISAQFCAAVPNALILEIDVDDVPWKDELITRAPAIQDGYLAIPSTPGWGADLNEEAVRAHPWPRPGAPRHSRYGP